MENGMDDSLLLIGLPIDSPLDLIFYHCNSFDVLNLSAVHAS